MALPAPAVAADLYDDAYYRTVCAGAEAWRGEGLDPAYVWSLRFARLQPGETLLDVGCGRGELLVAAAQAGAQRAIGVEYSDAALALARETVAAHDVADRCEVLAADARALPVPDAGVDLVTLLDVVEHLTPEELAGALAEARRVLRPGGRVFVHTMPNRYVFTVTYRAMALLAPWLPRDPRTEHERLMHVNEMTLSELERALTTAGFGGVRAWRGKWVRTDFVGRFGARVYGSLARRPRTRWLAVADLWAEGTAPGRRPRA